MNQKNNSNTDQTIFSEETNLKRDLGLLEAVSIVIGRIIGSGIFRTPAPIMALVLTAPAFGLVWLIAGIITVFSAVCYAELVAMLPRSGGPYIYLKAAYPPLWTFLRGWAMFFVSETASIVAVALVFAEYLSGLWQILYGHPLPGYSIIILALAAIWLLTIVNCFGVFLSGLVQDIFSFIKVAAIGAIIGICFTSGGNWGHFSGPVFPEGFSMGSIFAFGAALRYAFFAYSGWEGATYVAEEVKNPRRNLPLSLLIGITGVFILYFGANSAYLYQLPPAKITGSNVIAVDALQMAIGSIGGIFISIAVMVNTFGNVSTQILCKARTWQAMARDGLFFKKFAIISDRYKTPNYSMVFQGLWATVLLLFASTSEHSYEAIIDFFACTGIIFNMMTFASIFILRRKFPHVNRPYKAWLYPYSIVVVMVFYAVYLVITLATAFIPSLMGLLLTASGLVYYYREKIFYRSRGR